MAQWHNGQSKPASRYLAIRKQMLTNFLSILVCKALKSETGFFGFSNNEGEDAVSASSAAES